ncbi:MAG: hypothetical protein BGO31_11575 [Bacteroidetes bacterium 43-16]|nr:MAG: hypothetical protein BGO31_11575 [Bacteroidetes bacterium 43-16]
MNKDFLDSSIKLFEYYKSLAEKAMAQVSDEKLFWQYNADSNSIAIIVQHLWGNMLSRWTDFLTADGEKEWRDRDAEFEDLIRDRTELYTKWEAGWACLLQALRPLNESDLNKIVYIRNQGHTVTEAITRQLAHYASHVGQIIYIAKMVAEQPWQTLSIAKGASNDFNQEKFALEKSKQHFTDEFTKDKSE